MSASDVPPMSHRPTAPRNSVSPVNNVVGATRVRAGRRQVERERGRARGVSRRVNAAQRDRAGAQRSPSTRSPSSATICGAGTIPNHAPVPPAVRTAEGPRGAVTRRRRPVRAAGRARRCDRCARGCARDSAGAARARASRRAISRDVVAAVDHDRLAGRRVAENRAVAAQRPDRERVDDHGGGRAGTRDPEIAVLAVEVAERRSARQPASRTSPKKMVWVAGGELFGEAAIDVRERPVEDRRTARADAVARPRRSAMRGSPSAKRSASARCSSESRFTQKPLRRRDQRVRRRLAVDADQDRRRVGRDAGECVGGEAVDASVERRSSRS